MDVANSTRSEVIAEQNDLFRTLMQSVCVWRGHLLIGNIVCSSGVANLSSELLEDITEKVRQFSAFTPDNDPHREHDFGKIIAGPDSAPITVFWKFDYYSSDAYECGSENPHNPRETRRMLTIMLASEY